jgi:hypothetical protein
MTHHQIILDVDVTPGIIVSIGEHLPTVTTVALISESGGIVFPTMATTMSDRASDIVNLLNVAMMCTYEHGRGAGKSDDQIEEVIHAVAEAVRNGWLDGGMMTMRDTR